MKAIRWLLKLVLAMITLPLILAVWLIKWFVVFCIIVRHAVPQLPERYLSRKAGIVRCCLRSNRKSLASMIQPVFRPKQPEYGLYLYLGLYDLLYNANAKQIV